MLVDSDQGAESDGLQLGQLTLDKTNSGLQLVIHLLQIVLQRVAVHGFFDLLRPPDLRSIEDNLASVHQSPLVSWLFRVVLD